MALASSPPAFGADAHPAHPTNVKTGKRSGDAAARRSIAGGPTTEDLASGPESPELRSLREAERELFPTASPAPGSAWPSDLPALFPGDAAPHVWATGLPPGAPQATAHPAPPPNEVGMGWLAQLEMPDLPVRWDERVVRYLTYFRDDPRGHATFANLYRHSGRWRDMIRRVLRSKGEPEDLMWVAMIESGFDPVARSSAGAAGLWQFMPETAKIYGLYLDRWLDQRLGPQPASQAAADFLGDLHRRFGSWELALAGFNMGYVGLSSVVRRYNTNDFWSLARTEGTLPWETTLYVPKVLAAAVVAHNLAAFGFADVALDPAVDTDEVDTPPGTSLALVAQAACLATKDVEALNPELRAGRTPPDSPYRVKVPLAKGATATQGLARLRRDQPPTERYIVRFGETLDQIAAARGTTTQKLGELNGIAPGESVRGGAVLLVPLYPSGADTGLPVPAGVLPPPAASPPAKPSVVVPADLFVYPDRRRVFYRVLVGDTLPGIAASMHVTVDELRRWNDLDASARLQEGMTLQAFAARDADLSAVAVLDERDVRVLPVGSDEFFAALERDKGFRRVTVFAKVGETLEAIGRRYDVSARTMERINRRSRRDVLAAGDAVVVYVPVAGRPASTVAQLAPGNAASATPAVTIPGFGPLPPLAPPIPDLLP
jgi:membrane-bound lytic murein transglycosylase D